MPLGAQFKLFDEMSPKSEIRKPQIVQISYSQAIASLMNAMVCTRANIIYPVSVVSRFMTNFSKNIGML